MKARCMRDEKCRNCGVCRRTAAQNEGAGYKIPTWVSNDVKKITKVPLMIAKIEISGTAKTKAAIRPCVADCYFYCLQAFLKVFLERLRLFNPAFYKNLSVPIRAQEISENEVCSPKSKGTQGNFFQVGKRKFPCP